MTCWSNSRHSTRGAARPLSQSYGRAYDLLLLKVLSLLQDKDPALARDIAASREALWNLLADPAKFANLSFHWGGSDEQANEGLGADRLERSSRRRTRARCGRPGGPQGFDGGDRSARSAVWAGGHRRPTGRQRLYRDMPGWKPLPRVRKLPGQGGRAEAVSLSRSAGRSASLSQASAPLPLHATQLTPATADRGCGTGWLPRSARPPAFRLRSDRRSCGR